MRLERSAKNAGVERIVSFGEHPDADARLLRCSLQPNNSTVQANILGSDVTYQLGAPGRHVVLNSLAVLAALALLGSDLALGALALSELRPAPGRGRRIRLDLPGGTATLIDESYNANPSSMRAALALLAQAEIGARGRRIAVLGDMLELGPRGPEFHRDLAAALVEHRIDLVYCSGPLMRTLWDALPASRRGGYADVSSQLEPQVLAAVGPGDAVMVKGSLGSRMTPIANALASRHGRGVPDTRRPPAEILSG
jgi:UDP-N-acetylmuramoyl-tripeptide--D-alanyl-D-alanine ligase